MPRPFLAAIAVLAGAGIVLAILGRIASPPAAAIEIAPAPEATPPPPAVVVVDVGGAVARPGVLRLPAGSRVIDALAAAGGTAPEADLSALNRAAPLRDGERIYVPRAGEVPPRAGGGDTRVDLNRATPAELEALPGIGPGIAARIVRAREQRAFARPEELQTRGFVSARVFAELRDLVVVR